MRGLVASNLEMIKDYAYLAGYIMTELHQQPERAHQAAALIPGCREEIETKLATAIERGEIDKARLDRWRKLLAEDAFNSASLAQRREKDKAFGKMVRQVKKQKKRKGWS